MAAAPWVAALAGWAAAAMAFATAARARRLAETDALTGLPNRRGLARAWARAGGQLRLHFLDLSGFRTVNATHGHAVGDRVLAEVAGRLKAALPDGSALARHGGDEFVVLAPLGCDPEPALAGALATPVRLPDGGALQLGLWLGSAPPDATGLETALAAAITDMGRRRAAAGAKAASAAVQRG